MSPGHPSQSPSPLSHISVAAYLSSAKMSVATLLVDIRRDTLSTPEQANCRGLALRHGKTLPTEVVGSARVRLLMGDLEHSLQRDIYTHMYCLN